MKRMITVALGIVALMALGQGCPMPITVTDVAVACPGAPEWEVGAMIDIIEDVKKRGVSKGEILLAMEATCNNAEAEGVGESTCDECFVTIINHVYGN